MSIPSVPFGKEQIEVVIPHRSPFLLLEKVTEMESGKRIVAELMVDAENPVFKGHFPGNPVLPGVYQVEGLAQTSGVLVGYMPGLNFSSCVLTTVDKVRFRYVVKPGELLRYEVELVKHRAGFFWFEGKAFVGDQLACSAEFSARSSSESRNPLICYG